MVLRTLILCAFGLWAAAPALACSPAPGTPGTVTKGDACSIYYQDEEYTSRGIGGAKDLGQGFVQQFFFSGNACYGQVSMIVTDCSAARAAIFGPGNTLSPMTFDDPVAVAENLPYQTLHDAIEAAAEAGKPLSVQDIIARARGKFINAGIVNVRGRVGISNTTERPLHWFDLKCACRLFYKTSKGARG